MEKTEPLMCHWCNNPEDLNNHGPDKWCIVCSRYSIDHSTSKHLELHGCVMETVFIGKTPDSIDSVLYKCINPVRAHLSSEYLASQNKCNKRFTLTKAEFDAGQTKGEMALEWHSWAWHNKFKEEWDAKEAKRQESLLSQEDIKNHPKYAEFLKLQENPKV